MYQVFGIETPQTYLADIKNPTLISTTCYLLAESIVTDKMKFGMLIQLDGLLEWVFDSECTSVMGCVVGAFDAFEKARNAKLQLAENLDSKMIPVQPNWSGVPPNLETRHNVMKEVYKLEAFRANHHWLFFKTAIWNMNSKVNHYTPKQIVDTANGLIIAHSNALKSFLYFGPAPLLYTSFLIKDDKKRLMELVSIGFLPSLVNGAVRFLYIFVKVGLAGLLLLASVVLRLSGMVRVLREDDLGPHA